MKRKLTMRIRLSELRRIIRESIIDPEVIAADEAPAGAPLGRIAFASQRPDMPYEPDTKKEEELLAAIEKHFFSSTPINTNFTELLRQLLDKGWYSPVINEPPSGTTLMRGMGVTRKWLQKATGLSSEEIIELGTDEKGSLECEFNFTPKLGTSSWTSDYETAEMFAQFAREKGWIAIIYANVDSNPKKFISGPKGLYKLNRIKASPVSQEDESLGVGMIKCCKIEWRIPSDEDDEYE